MKLFQKLISLLKKFGINANKIELSANDVLNLLAGNTINLTSKNIVISSDYLTIDKKGNFIFKVSGLKIFQVQNDKDSSKRVYITDQAVVIDHSSGIDRISMSVTGAGEGILTCSGNGYTSVLASGITTPKLTQTSLESEKKNIEKLNIDAIKLVKNADICTYNFKTENDNNKKHIGLIIGEKYNCPSEVISEDGKGIEQYSYTSLLYKAFQQLVEKVEKLEKEVANGKN